MTPYDTVVTADAALSRTEAMPPISLADVQTTADLQRRVDRKYIVDPAPLDSLLELLSDGGRVLDIDGRRHFRYESVYFDTPDHHFFLGAAHRRPDRCKVRTRTYLDAGTSWFEIKVRSRHGHTVKHRRSHDDGRRDRLTAESIDFLTAFPQTRLQVADLRATVRTAYERTTLVHADQRITIDADLASVAVGAERVAGVGIGAAVIVETKSDRHAGACDRALWALGVRPVTISKYAIGLAAVRPELPTNKWHRTIDRHVRPLDDTEWRDLVGRRDVVGCEGQ